MTTPKTFAQFHYFIAIIVIAVFFFSFFLLPSLLEKPTPSHSHRQCRHTSFLFFIFFILYSLFDRVREGERESGL
jgi:Na+/proline symporter